MAAVDPLSRGDRLSAFGAEVAGCTRCRLAEGRTQVVFGVGNPEADLMFVGEAPGFHEDQQGYPFVGQAGKLLDRLLAGIGLDREDVYIANVLKCRPPGNRDPHPDEIEACERAPLPPARADRAEARRDARELRHEAPLRASRTGSRAFTAPRRTATVGGRAVTLYPLFHPAAALYTPAMLRTLENDFARIPALLAREPGTPRRPAVVIPLPVARRLAGAAARARREQLGLF